MRLTKMGKLTLAMALCLVLGLASTASAFVLPLQGLYVDGVKVADFVQSGNTFTAASGLNSAQFTFDSDPAIGWSFNATNGTGSAVDFAAVFVFPGGTPGFPGPISVHADSGTSLTGDNATIDPVALSPFPFINKIATNYTLNAALSVFENAWGTGDSFAVASGTDVQKYVFDGIGAGFPNDVFVELVSFKLSAGDHVGLSGECSFVPVPPSVLLFGSGMLSIGLLGWRRKRLAG